MSDYHDSDMTEGGAGYYRVWYRRSRKPAGPFPTVLQMAAATSLTDYPVDGYVVHFDGRVVGSVPSLNPDDLLLPELKGAS